MLQDVDNLIHNMEAIICQTRDKAMCNVFSSSCSLRNYYPRPYSVLLCNQNTLLGAARHISVAEIWKIIEFNFKFIYLFIYDYSTEHIKCWNEDVRFKFM